MACCVVGICLVPTTAGLPTAGFTCAMLRRMAWVRLADPPVEHDEAPECADGALVAECTPALGDGVECTPEPEFEERVPAH